MTLLRLLLQQTSKETGKTVKETYKAECENRSVDAHGSNSSICEVDAGRSHLWDQPGRSKGDLISKQQ